MKPWDVVLRTYEITIGGWRWELDSPVPCPKDMPGISVVDTRRPALATELAARRAARRAMKRLGLVERKAKAGKE